MARREAHAVNANGVPSSSPGLFRSNETTLGPSHPTKPPTLKGLKMFTVLGLDAAQSSGKRSFMNHSFRRLFQVFCIGFLPAFSQADNMCVELAKKLRTVFRASEGTNMQQLTHELFNTDFEKIDKLARDRNITIGATVPIPTPSGLPIPVQGSGSYKEKLRRYTWMKEVMSGSTATSFSLTQQSTIASEFVPESAMSVLRDCLKAHASGKLGGGLTVIPFGDLLPKSDGSCRIGLEVTYLPPHEPSGKQTGPNKLLSRISFNDQLLTVQKVDETSRKPTWNPKSKTLELYANTPVTVWLDRKGSISAGYEKAEILVRTQNATEPYQPEAIVLAALSPIPELPFDHIDVEAGNFELTGPERSQDLKNEEWPGHDGSVTTEFSWEINVDGDWNVHVRVWGFDRQTEGNFLKPANYARDHVLPYGALRQQHPVLNNYKLSLAPGEPTSGSARKATRPGQDGNVAFSPDRGIASRLEGPIGGGGAQGGKRTAFYRSFVLWVVPK